MENNAVSFRSKFPSQEIALAIETMHGLASIAERFRDGQLEDGDWRDLDELIEDAKRLYREVQG